MEKIANPFPVITYQGPEYFCDRVQEIERLQEAIKNGRNVTLIRSVPDGEKRD